MCFPLSNFLTETQHLSLTLMLHTKTDRLATELQGFSCHIFQAQELQTNIIMTLFLFSCIIMKSGPQDCMVNTLLKHPTHSIILKKDKGYFKGLLNLKTGNMYPTKVLQKSFLVKEVFDVCSLIGY